MLSTSVTPAATHVFETNYTNPLKSGVSCRHALTNEGQ